MIDNSLILIVVFLFGAHQLIHNSNKTQTTTIEEEDREIVEELNQVSEFVNGFFILNILIIISFHILYNIF